MVARAAFIKAKPRCEVNLARALEEEVVPLFRKQKGFRGFVAFVLPAGRKALSFSLWDQKETAEEDDVARSKALMAWREWSWEFQWFKFRRSRIRYPPNS
jgi:hypothetical protein